MEEMHQLAPEAANFILAYGPTSGVRPQRVTLHLLNGCFRARNPEIELGKGSKSHGWRAATVVSQVDYTWKCKLCFPELRKNASAEKLTVITPDGTITKESIQQMMDEPPSTDSEESSSEDESDGEKAPHQSPAVAVESDVEEVQARSLGCPVILVGNRGTSPSPYG